jgi:hypothetical protein
VNVPMRLYSQIYPYLSTEAKDLVQMLVDRGMDRDLAMQLVEMVMEEDQFYDL